MATSQLIPLFSTWILDFQQTPGHRSRGLTTSHIWDCQKLPQRSLPQRACQNHWGRRVRSSRIPSRSDTPNATYWVGQTPKPHLSSVLCQKLPFHQWSLPKRVRYDWVQKQKQGGHKRGRFKPERPPLSQKAAWGHSGTVCLVALLFSAHSPSEWGVWGGLDSGWLSSQPTSRGHHNQAPVTSLTYSASFGPFWAQLASQSKRTFLLSSLLLEQLSLTLSSLYPVGGKKPNALSFRVQVNV